MKRFAVMMSVVLTLGGGLCATGENWPGWRGPRGDGTVQGAAPVTWSATQNVTWKTSIEGVGHSSPVVWGDRVFVVSAVEETNERLLICVNRADGKVLWRRVVLVADYERVHKMNSRASSTPATDGQHVFVSFLDNDKMLIAAYDFDGNLVWKKHPGVFSSVHGYCSSPVIYKDTLIVNGDHDGPSYIVALDRATGETRWKIDRGGIRSYCTPLIRTIDGREQMILSGTETVASYDPNNGKQHWVIDGPTEQFVASLIYHRGLLFMTAGFPQRHMMAIKPDGRGNVTKTHIVWRTRTHPAYVPSPIAVGRFVLVVKDSGRLTCYEADTGKVHWQEQIGRQYNASPIAANGLAYFLGENGVTTVIRPGENFEVVATNDLGDTLNASPAVCDGQLFMRTGDALWLIEAPDRVGE
jgi:outer membrane protein assembly factor BamB